MTANPFNETNIREDKRPKKTYTDEQLRQIELLIENGEALSTTLSPNWFIKTLIYTFKLTGIRRKQLLGLKIKDINLTRRMITIPPEINKNHSHHAIPISTKLYPHLKQLLSEHKKRHSINTEQAFNINKFKHNDTYLRMVDNQLTRIFDVMSKLLKFHVSAHRFRHTLATKLMKDPKNIYITQQILGHSGIAVTLSYIEKDPETLREVLEML